VSDIRIDLSLADYQALPENQRFLVDQLRLLHETPPRETPKFSAEVVSTGKQKEDALLAAKNRFGGFTTPFRDPRKP